MSLEYSEKLSMNLIEMINSGVSEITEFKTSLAEWMNVVETFSAFSNIIGVDNIKNTINKRM